MGGMRLSVSGQFSLKGRLEDYRGVIGEHWNIGKDEPVSFSEMVLAFVSVASRFYTLFCGVDELNTELDELRRELVGLSHSQKNVKRCGR